MGERLLEIVARVKRGSRGLINVNLARLNLRVGSPLSRYAATIPDDPELVARASEIADELLAREREDADVEGETNQ